MFKKIPLSFYGRYFVNNLSGKFCYQPTGSRIFIYDIVIHIYSATCVAIYTYILRLQSLFLWLIALISESVGWIVHLSRKTKGSILSWYHLEEPSSGWNHLPSRVVCFLASRLLRLHYNLTYHSDSMRNVFFFFL